MSIHICVYVYMCECDGTLAVGATIPHPRASRRANVSFVTPCCHMAVFMAGHMSLGLPVASWSSHARATLSSRLSQIPAPIFAMVFALMAWRGAGRGVVWCGVVIWCAYIVGKGFRLC